MDETLKNQLEILIRFWEHSSEPWGARDNQSRFIYSNPRNHKLLGLPVQYNLEGRFDGEMPTPMAEFQDQWQEHDRKVELLQDRITTVEIHVWDGSSQLRPYLCDKFQLIDKHGFSQGVVCHVRPVQDMVLAHLNKIKVPTSLIFTPPSDLFTKREWEVLFYILHSYSSKDIARKIHLSPRTVSNIIQGIYRKVGVSNKQQMVDYCYENKINNYVPQSFFEYSKSFPLM
ncbi:helix-turn-helix transcriptional regulator [Yersinia proxima]|uniref:helix-turn-helix transcriptional regulator n=1 Tax=Yersinia proxima TaxID=2890316 RepID=UPI001D10E622|nr:PAS and helix-turn-helix domain-containing protein [Yersinia proxima]